VKKKRKKRCSAVLTISFHVKQFGGPEVWAYQDYQCYSMEHRGQHHIYRTCTSRGDSKLAKVTWS
jgi:hypothetical protein